jgi:hypothetical protein
LFLIHSNHHNHHHHPHLLLHINKHRNLRHHTRLTSSNLLLWLTKPIKFLGIWNCMFAHRIRSCFSI